MFRLTLSVCCLLLAAVTPATAEYRTTLFGPATYVRSTKEPNLDIRRFRAQGGTANVRIINGSQGVTGQKVSQASVKLNGTALVGPEWCQRGEPIIDIDVGLAVGDNTIAVELFGKPGGALAITVTQAARVLIAGVVTDRSTGNPIVNARVRVVGTASGEVRTDATGAYAFQVEDLIFPSGVVSGTLQFDAPGYFEATLPIGDLSGVSVFPVVRDRTLLPGGDVVRGTVRDVFTRAAIAGAIVAFTSTPASSFRGAGPFRVTTGPDGVYRIDASYFSQSGIASGFSTSLEVTAIGGYAAASRSVNFTTYPTVQDFDLSNATGLIAGVVTNRTTGQAVPNARVTFSGSASGTVFTDSTGRYTFRASDLTASGGAIWGTLYVLSTGYFESLGVNVSDLASQPSLPVIRNITLLPGGIVLRGTVRDAVFQQPIGAAAVTFYTVPPIRNPTGSTSTASDGSYGFDSSRFNECVVTGSCGTISITLNVNANGYLGVSRTFSLTSYPVTQNFDLAASNAGLITGVVTNRTTGQAVPNARVTFSGSASGTVFTDSTGRYTFRASDLTASGGAIWGTLYVLSTGYFESLGVYISDLAGQPSLPVIRHITLLPGGIVLRGTVRDAVSQQPIGAAAVTFYTVPPIRNPTGSTSTASDGSYGFDSSRFNECVVTGSCGTISITLNVNANGYLGVSRTFSLTSYPVTQNFDLAASNAGLITGVVTNRTTGQAVPNARVTFSGSASGTVFTDSTGRYTFRASDLTASGGAIWGTLYVLSTGYFESLGVNVSDLASQPSLPVIRHITLMPGGIVLRGTVRDAVSQQPIGAAAVTFYTVPPIRNPTGSTSTASDGSYGFDSSQFNECVVTGSCGTISITLNVNANGYLGVSRTFSLTSYPVTQDFNLVRP